MLELKNLLQTAGYKISDTNYSYEDYIQRYNNITIHDYYNLSIEHDMTSLNYINFQIDSVINNLSRETLIFDTLSSLANNRSTEASNTYFEVLDKLGMSLEDLADKTKEIFQKVWEAIKAAFRKIGELFGKIIRWFKNLFSGKKRQEDKEIQQEIPKVVEEIKSENTKKINEKFFKLTITMKTTGGENIINPKANETLFHKEANDFYKNTVNTFNDESSKVTNSVVDMLKTVGEKEHDEIVAKGEKTNARIFGDVIKNFDSTFGIQINEGSMKAVDKIVNRFFYATEAPKKQKVPVRNIILKIPQSVLDDKIHVFSSEIDNSLKTLEAAMKDMNRKMDKYEAIVRKHKQDKKITKAIMQTFNGVKTGYTFLLQFAYKFKKEAESIRNDFKKAYKLYKKYTVSDGDKSDIEVTDKERQNYDDAMKLKKHIENGGKVEL